jgi:dienelactone hydrolase
MKGFVVYDDATKAKRPGIVMVHEWWGITKHIHNEARNFAQQGYTVLISDMFGDARTADNPKDAGARISRQAQTVLELRRSFRGALGENSLTLVSRHRKFCMWRIAMGSKSAAMR